jgi:hypothetical protein
MDVDDRGNSMGRLWFTTGKQSSINFNAIWADDVVDNLPMNDVDEEWLTIILPKKLRLPVAVNTDALAAHFSYGAQEDLEKTDLLARYQDNASEEVCRRKFVGGTNDREVAEKVSPCIPPRSSKP